MTRLAPCPLCDDPGPWTTTAARAAHIRAHHTADCGLCGQPVNASGLDAHMRYIHADEPEPEAPEPVDAETAPTEASQAPEPPETAIEEPESAPFRCPDCDAGPFATRRGLVTHRRSHLHVTCDECGKTMKATGLGSHQRKHRPTQVPARSTLTAVLAKMIPGAAHELIDRLTEFIDQAREKPEPGLWIVAPLNGTRPWLCRTTAIGVVVAREHAATLVVSVDDIAAELHRPQALAS